MTHNRYAKPNKNSDDANNDARARYNQLLNCSTDRVDWELHEYNILGRISENSFGDI